MLASAGLDCTVRMRAGGGLVSVNQLMIQRASVRIYFCYSCNVKRVSEYVIACMFYEELFALAGGARVRARAGMCARMKE